MSESIERPDEVTRFERINKYLLILNAIVSCWAINNSPNHHLISTGMLFGVLILGSGLTWILILLITRKRSRFFYILTLLFFVGGFALSIINFQETIKDFSVRFFELVSFVISAYSLYLMTTKNFRDWIFKNSLPPQ
jgi:hypothetical protein